MIGLEHPTRGQMIKAYVVLKEGTSLTEGELRTYMKGQMSAYAVPHAIEFRDGLPKNNIGKILKRLLVEEEQAKH